MRDLIYQQSSRLKNSKNKHEFCKKLALCCEQLPCNYLPVLLSVIIKENNNVKYINEFKKCKIAILSNFTVDAINDYLQLIGLSRGIDLTTYYPGYNQYTFEISNNQSQLYQLKHDYIVLIIDETVIFQEYEDKLIIIKKIKEFTTYFLALLSKLTSSTNSKIIVNSICLSKQFIYGYIDYESRVQISLEINKLNQHIAEFILSNQDVFLIDTSIILQHKKISCLRDERLALYAKMQMNDEVLRQLAIEVTKIITSTCGYSKKCIALDLDNTLWDGIIGDDGSDNIDLGKTVTGSEFQHLQKLLKHLQKQGIVLAINSKNDEKNVDDAFANNKEMILQKDDFINIKTNWRPKHENLIAIADESNISLDSILFVDDSDVECALVENFLPATNIICANDGPIKVIEQIIGLGYFEKVKSTKEDIIRTKMYQSERDRKTFLSSVNSISDFLEHLNIQVEIFHPDEHDIPRLHQLVMRTNQFNLTTKRYSECQITKFINGDNHLVISANVSDKFGPYELVSVAFLKIVRDSMIIDNFILSCRVFSRGIEDAMLSSIMTLAKLKNMKIVKGLYVASAKNVNTKGFYSSKGFDPVIDNEECNIFKKSVDIIPKYPDWLTVKTSLQSSLKELEHVC